MFDFLTRPVRGVGRILRGKFKEGIDDIGYGVKSVAPVVGLANPLLGAGLMAAGSVANQAEEGIGKIKFGKQVLAPAAATYGVGKALQALKGAGTAAQGVKTAAAAPTSAGAKGASIATDVAEPLIGPGRAGAATAAQSFSAAAAPAPTAGGVAKLLQGGRGTLSSVGRWAGKNPVLASGLAGSAMQAYGAYEEGNAYDSQLRYEREREDAIRKRLAPYIEQLAQLINRQQDLVGR